MPIIIELDDDQAYTLECEIEHLIDQAHDRIRLGNWDDKVENEVLIDTLKSIIRKLK